MPGYKIKWCDKKTWQSGESDRMDLPIEIMREALKSADEIYPFCYHWIENEKGEKVE